MRPATTLFWLSCACGTMSAFSHTFSTTSPIPYYRCRCHRRRDCFTSSTCATYLDILLTLLHHRGLYLLALGLRQLLTCVQPHTTQDPTFLPFVHVTLTITRSFSGRTSSGFTIPSWPTSSSSHMAVYSYLVLQQFLL